MIRALSSIFVLTLTFSEASASELIGMVVPPYPGEISDGRGACIGQSHTSVCKRCIGILKTVAGREFLIISETAEPRVAKKARWRVADALAFPSLRRGEELDYGDCRLSGKPDDSIIAVLRIKQKDGWVRAIRWAYRVDEHTNKFIKVSPANVDCAESDQ